MRTHTNKIDTKRIMMITKSHISIGLILTFAHNYAMLLEKCFQSAYRIRPNITTMVDKSYLLTAYRMPCNLIPA